MLVDSFMIIALFIYKIGPLKIMDLVLRKLSFNQQLLYNSQKMYFCLLLSLAVVWASAPAEITDGTCYEDDRSRLLDDSHTSSTNTPTECKRTCAGRGYAYAGVQYTNQCFCGNTKPPASRIRDSSQCNIRCPGDASLKCGGAWRMNIYTTGNPSTPTGWRLKDNANCWKHCGDKGGSCLNFCGHNGYCCRKGWDDCLVGAAEVSPPNYHACVQQTG